MEFLQLSNEAKANAIVSFKEMQNKKYQFDQMSLVECYDFVTNHRVFVLYDIDGNEIKTETIEKEA